MRRNLRRIVEWHVLLGVATAAGLCGCEGRRGSGERPVVRIGYQKGDTLNLLRIRGGLEPELTGAGVRVEWIVFPAGPQLLEALNAGSIDFGHTGDSPPVMAQAAGVPLVYVAHEKARPHAEAILVRAGSPLRSVADLKGKRVALNKGSNVHYLLVRALEEAGVPYNQVRTVFLPPADARAAFSGGSVDAWATWDPYLAEAEAGEGARVLADAEGLTANREYYLATRPLVRDRQDVVRAILGAIGREGRWVTAHLDEAVRVLQAELGLAPDVLRRALGRRGFGVAPMDEAVVVEQQRLADAFVALGLIPRKIVVRDAVVELGPLESADQGTPKP
jgi:sulfonate transport system substrate-binding protein